MPDDVVRVDAGLVHLTYRTYGDERWAVLLDADGCETPMRIWLVGRTRVLELVRPARTGKTKDDEVRDPLRGAERKGGLC